jgi:hypothetical protein
MGCCLVSLLLVGAPRLAIIVWWLLDSTRFTSVFSAWVRTVGSVTFPVWVWPLVGFVFLPWSTVAYVFVAPHGINTLEWVVLAVALLFDLGTHGGSGRSWRRRHQG